jgi:hypothetical protein
MATPAPATPAPADRAEPRWERLPDQSSLADATMTAVAAGPDGYVAVGSARLADDQAVGMA